MDNETLLNMDPLELLQHLSGEVRFEDLQSLDTEEMYAVATKNMNAATAYICYFKQMETSARIRKRSAKRNKEAEEAERLMGVEEVFETFKRISEQQFEYVCKLFTAKRLVLEEFRKQGGTI